MKKLKVLIVRDEPQIVISVSLKHHIYTEKEKEREQVFSSIIIIKDRKRFLHKLFIMVSLGSLVLMKYLVTFITKLHIFSIYYSLF